MDHISAKPLLPEVKTVMIEAIEKDYHNPASQHKSGEEAAAVLQKAREAVAVLLNCSTPKEIVFTSGGTESANHAIKGVAMANEDKGKHIITSNIEHNAVIRSLRRLKASGFAVTSLPVDSGGRVNPKDVAEAITKDTILVSMFHLMFKNWEWICSVLLPIPFTAPSVSGACLFAVGPAFSPFWRGAFRKIISAVVLKIWWELSGPVKQRSLRCGTWTSGSFTSGH
jgi:hypothetical protein